MDESHAENLIERGLSAQRPRREFRDRLLGESTAVAVGVARARARWRKAGLALAAVLVGAVSFLGGRLSAPRSLTPGADPAPRAARTRPPTRSRHEPRRRPRRRPLKRPRSRPSNRPPRAPGPRGPERRAPGPEHATSAVSVPDAAPAPASSGDRADPAAAGTKTCRRFRPRALPSGKAFLSLPFGPPQARCTSVRRTASRAPARGTVRMRNRSARASTALSWFSWYPTVSLRPPSCRRAIDCWMKRNEY